MKVIGLQNEKVKLSEYSLAWEKLYKKEEKLLCPLVKKYGLGIEHIGSTAVPGFKAKPIIDIKKLLKNITN